MGKKGPKWIETVKKALTRSPSKRSSHARNFQSDYELNVSLDSIRPIRGSMQAEKTQTTDNRKKWLFGKSPSRRHRSKAVSISPPPETAALPEYFVMSPNEDQNQNQRAFAVAAAAANAAQAAIAAAQAAAAIVRLRASLYDDKSIEVLQSAIKIQSYFRGYLARKALRALKGLVKLQALVRGHAVRKRAAMTLRCVQAIVKVQALVRGRRLRRSEIGQMVQMHLLRRRQQKLIRQPSRKLYATASAADHAQDSWKDHNRKEPGLKLSRNTSGKLQEYSNRRSQIVIGSDSNQPHWDWSWLERWTAARTWESSNNESFSLSRAMIEDAKIKESAIVSRKHNSNINNQVDSSSYQSIPHPHAPSNSCPSPSHCTHTRVDHTQVKHVINQTHTFSNTLSSNMRNLHNDQGGFAELGRNSSTAGPSVTRTKFNAPSPHAVFAKYDKTSAVMVYSKEYENIFDFPASYPNYMALTESARAKIRTLTTPRDRPGTPDRDPPKSILMRNLSFSRSNSPIKPRLVQPSTARGASAAATETGANESGNIPFFRSRYPGSPG